uniref:Uncharacterized protein n=1 Tax=Aegilops tauschii subsp. strangulata TaxID=200361 RepID=A0A453JLH7_AEGTS
MERGTDFGIMEVVTYMRRNSFCFFLASCHRCMEGQQHVCGVGSMMMYFGGNLTYKP